MTLGNIATAIQAIITLLLGLLALWFTRVQTRLKIAEHRDRLQGRFAEISGAVWDLFATVAVSNSTEDYMAAMTRASKAGATGRWIIDPSFKAKMEAYMGAARHYWSIRTNESAAIDQALADASEALFDHRDQMLKAVDRAAMFPAIEESPIDTLRQMFRSIAANRQDGDTK